MDAWRLTSDPACCYPNYNNWEALPFSERLQLAGWERDYLNTLPRLHKKQITVKLVVKHNTDYADDKKIIFDFHGVGEFFYISYVANMGVLPLVYGTSFDDEYM